MVAAARVGEKGWERAFPAGAAVTPDRVDRLPRGGSPRWLAAVTRRDGVRIARRPLAPIIERDRQT